MLVTVRNNDNTVTTYGFAPANGRIAEAASYYVNQYMTLQIQGFQIEDEQGKVVKFAGSI